MIVGSILGLGVTVIAAAMLLSWVYGHSSSRGVWTAAVPLLVLGLFAVLQWRSGGTGAETPLLIDLTVVIVTGGVIAALVNTAGRRENGFILRASLAALGGVIAFLAASFLGYVGWLWLS